MVYNDIAIIGVSGRFTESDNLGEFHELLVKEKDCIIDVPQNRVDLMKLNPDKKYIQAGYLEHIEYFDHDFFNISNREADLMSPEQRLSLELVAETILDAGYSIEGFRGTNCSVICATSENEYGNLVKNTTAPSVLGSLKCMLSGKIGFYFDLRGTNLTLDAGCSSSLVAIHEACIKLMTGESDYSLVGGVEIFTEIYESKKNIYDILGVFSSQYKSKSFGEGADGASAGEGGGFVLLKRLEDAKRDGNNIYGVIKGGAINGDGGRCGMVTLPSSEGQKEVIEKAWNGIDISNLTEIESHGIGNPIGDCVEAISIIENLRKRNVINKEILLSCVKPNIGHLAIAAGISSLIKVLVGFKYNESYPIVNFEKTNHMIDFSKSALIPATKIKKWNSNDKRMVGIEAFGLSGTNAHIIVENYPQITKPKEDHRNLITISAKSETSFNAYKKELFNYLSEHNSISFNSIAYTLNHCRDDYDFRRMVIAEDLDDFLEKLDMMMPISEQKKYKIVFAMKFSNCSELNLEQYKNIAPGLNFNSNIFNKDASFKYGMYKYLKSLGVKPDFTLADYQSRAILDYISGKIDLASLEESIETSVDNNYEKLIAQIKKISENDDVIILDFNYSNALKNESFDRKVQVFNLFSVRDIEKFMIAYYNSGNSVNWNSYYGDVRENIVSLPGYCFDKVSHWTKLKHNEEIYEMKLKEVAQTQEEFQEVESTQENTNTFDFAEAENFLEGLWKKTLNFSGSIDHDEDFFDLGGNSLLLLQMSEEINNYFNISFDIYEIYDYESIEKLTQRISEWEC